MLGLISHTYWVLCSLYSCDAQFSVYSALALLTFSVRREFDPMKGRDVRTRKSGKRGVARKKISELLDSGMNQAEIARKLNLTRATINYHVRLLEYVDIPFRKVAPIRNGSRQCFVCQVNKELAAFKNGRASTCAACVRARSKQKTAAYT
jgi:hypothetical protein